MDLFLGIYKLVVNTVISYLQQVIIIYLPFLVF